MVELQSVLRTIKDRDTEIKAWAYLAEGESIEQPADDPGSLQGLLFGVKDVIDVQGMPTACGASLAQTPPSTFDASCVAQLRAAGAVPIGKTVTAEYAFTAPGPTRNPWNLAYSPGGSSSGSAAAVAAGMVPMALGTQTGGSIIRPAAFNGVVGFKPTFGYVHRAGMTVLCDTLDTIGWFTRDVDMSIKVADIFLPGHSAGLPETSDLRIAVLPCENAALLSSEGRNTLDQAAAALQPQCRHVEWVYPDKDVEVLRSLHASIMRYELARGLLPVWRSEPGALSASTVDGIRRGLQLRPEAYADMQAKRAEIQLRWHQRFAEYDFIVTPSAPGEAPEGLSTTGSSVFNCIWSMLGWPCIHLPCALSPKGLPLGVQWVAKPGQDALLLQLARRLHPLIDRRGDEASHWPES
jgi:Asp-tRNA(Asn)/Glu-tRNA(Gln) amidotransferase A subunit family amidase